MITENSLTALRTRLDIIEVISAYIPLKKAGLNFQACCPFHGEKTPSFVVSPKKQMYHCFGCGVSGDGIKFVQEFEKLTFGEAAQKLADTFGVVISHDKISSKPSTNSLELFASFFTKIFANNAFAKEYLKKRSINEQTIEKFGIGYAPGTKEQLDFAQSRHLNMNELIELGVFAAGDKGVYARFVDRLIFPIKNQSGKVIGFGGRTLGNHPAKYINSPATPLFNKSEVLYGYDIAKDTIAKSKELILCEGYMDVLALHQNGFTNAVAVLGTALTQKHLPQIKRFDARVFLSFDGDKAGLGAAFKSANLLIANDVLGSVVKWGEGLDPADLITKPNEIKARLSNGQSLYEFILQQELKAFDLSDLGQKKRAAKRIGEVLASFGDVVANGLREYAAAILGTNEIKIAKQKQTYTSQNAATTVDFKEASIIRAMACSPLLLEYGATRLHPEFFKTYKNAFAALCSNDEDSLELLKALTVDNIAPIDGELFYEYITSLKRDFLTQSAKFLRENGRCEPEFLRRLARECAKGKEIDDDFLEQILAKYKEATR